MFYFVGFNRPVIKSGRQTIRLEKTTFFMTVLLKIVFD